jgi:hypothetical protein
MATVHRSGLELLQQDIHYSISLFLYPLEILSLTSVNHSFRQIFLAREIWDAVSLRLFVKHSLPLQIRNSFQFVKSCLSRQIESQLFSDVVQTSSVDRQEENGRNLLTESYCHNLLNLYRHQIQNNPRLGIQIQARCGCMHGQPCYWSSAGTASPDDNEEILFSAIHSLIVLTGFHITAYQSFFHPNFPIYAPYMTQLQLLLPDRATVYYQSPVYEVVSDSSNQWFPLPNQQLFCGGFIKIRLLGKRQAQPIGPSDFYTCLSHASVSGKVLDDFQSELTDGCCQISLREASEGKEGASR